MTDLYGHPPPRRRASGCSSAIAMVLVLAVVIGGAIALSPGLTFSGVRDVVYDRHLDGVPGSGGEGYSFLSTYGDDRPITWPCAATIDIEVNPAGAPERYDEMLASALDRVNARTDFTFVISGETDDRTFEDRRAGPVLLGWADEEEIPALAGPVAGLGGAVYVTGGPRPHAVGGMVVIDTDLDRGFLGIGGIDEETVIVHELLHVLGLGHSEDPDQLMAARSRGQAEFGEGDLAGLAALEAEACGDR